MEPVQGRRTIAVQDFEDRLVVGRRQRSLDSHLQPDGVRDLGGCVAESSSLESLGDQASSGRLEPDACNPHVFDDIGLDQALPQARRPLAARQAAQPQRLAVALLVGVRASRAAAVTPVAVRADRQ